MMLIYSKETVEGLNAEEDHKHRMAHRSVITEATEKGVLVGAEPLAPVSTATTVRMQNGKPLVTDGPFAETKEQLAGYYIIDCADLEDAKQWAAKIPTACFGGSGCVEIRALPGLQNR
jgi:hypothetical protein